MFRKKTNTKLVRNTPTTTSAPVFSYYSNRSRNDETMGRSDPATKLSTIGSRSFGLHTLPAVIAILAVTAGVFYFTTLSLPVRIVRFSDDTQNLLQASETYAAYAEEVFNESLFNKNKLTISSSNIERKLKTRFSELKDVSVVVPIVSRRPVVYLQPAEPVLLLASASGAYLIDEDGRALADVRSTAGSIAERLPRVYDDTGTDVEIGSAVLTKDAVRFIAELVAQFEAASTTIESITLPLLPYEVHVRINGEGYYVKFHMLEDARLQSGALFAVRERLQAAGAKPGEYIDVRLADKVYYR